MLAASVLEVAGFQVIETANVDQAFAALDTQPQMRAIIAVSQKQARPLLSYCTD